MMTTILMTVAPRSVEWSPTIGLIMVVCNILAIAFGKLTIKNPSVGPAMPSSNMFGGLSLGAVLGTTALGHILGAGTILGLSYIGAI
ncbi:MAG: photosystem I reaction center subunit PsaK [Oscillatoriales cyanobacterium RU_3_3]|nr:photosystem I reaction center subunit PsaK [Microcoleus sp. SU_5_6]NJL67235.1 photosystem I reaction center subunit PsaK [Microcoleus sp. SM1_3_4]NJM62139.1 photosystem I reaction center subunit PsaK [Oscillatoriales cyanobacterium RU_3_3]NJR23968.1 photosystem I reaction center subunit PsaK [Richelia sp. CSU_2_1]